MPRRKIITKILMRELQMPVIPGFKKAEMFCQKCRNIRFPNLFFQRIPPEMA